MESKLKLIVTSLDSNRVKFNESVSFHSALSAGGPAKLFVTAFSLNELIKIIEMCTDLTVPFIVFGTGSKMIISDNGFNGVVIKNNTRNIKIVSIKGKVSKFGIGVDQAYIEVDSGVTIKKFVDFLNTQGLVSNEFVNIPGTIGGNLFLNKALQDKTESVQVLNSDMKVEKVSPNVLSLDKHIILNVVLKIKSRK